MEGKDYKLYGYRWVVLASFMLVNLAIQVLWISYAPISSLAASFYGVNDLKIGLLAMLYMIAFLPLSLPVSWAIDTIGFKKSVSIGVILMGIFGLVRGLAGKNFTLVFISTIFLAISQPFLLNSWTKIAALWFSTEESATAVGLVTLSNLLGTAAGMALTPILIEKLTIPYVQFIYGSFAFISALFFIIFAREKPPTPPCKEGQDVRALMLDGLKHAFKVKPFLIYLFISFIGMGIFNGVLTWIENIIRPRGFTPIHAGTLGALILVGGILGALIIPVFSDRKKKRVFFIFLGFLLCLPGLIGLAFVKNIYLLYISGFFMGFFLVSASPIGMQYAAEITRPTPEGTSNGIIQFFGQASVVFVYLMDALKTKNGSFTPAILLAIFLMLISLIFIMFLKDPDKMIKQI
jgi:cyanate permease